MAACFRLSAVVRTTSFGCGCQRLRLAPLSFLATQQHGENRPPNDRSSPACLVPAPHRRHETTFSRKRRKFVARHGVDGVDEGMALVYENNMSRLNFWGQAVINVMAVPVYTMSARIILSSWPVQDLSITSGPLTATAYILVYSALLFGVNSLCSRTIHRLYTDQDAVHFAAVVQDWKMTKKTVRFDLSAVERKPPSNVYGAFFGNLKILGRPYLVTPADFVQPRFYNILMGYDLQRSIEKDVIKDLDVKDLMRKAVQKPPQKSR